MRNVRFNDDVVKELRKLVRDSNKGNEFRAALTKIYQTGYDNGHDTAFKEATTALRRTVNANQSASPSHNDDRVGVQSDSSLNGGRQGVDATDSDSGEGSLEQLSQDIAHSLGEKY